MNFLGKLKDLVRHSGPPMPPQSIDNHHGYGWTEDEFDGEDGEDGGMYEAPPCERPAVKVPPRQIEENVYLERSSAPVSSRQAPPPRPPPVTPIIQALKQHDLEETYIDPNVQQPPQINREEKPGKMSAPRKAPPPRPRPAPTLAHSPAPNPVLEDDVYLDPNEGQLDDSDELYLEPNAACSPPTGVCMRPPPPILREALPPRGGPSRAPPPRGVVREAPPLSSGPHDVSPIKGGPSHAPPTWGGPREAPPVMMKPPVPRMLSNTTLLGDGKPAKPCLLIKPPPALRESKPSLPCSPMLDTAAVAPKKSPQSGTEDSKLLDKEWFAGICDRKTAEAVLSRVNKDGAFLVRFSSARSSRQPYTLVVLFRQKVFNIPVRYLEDTQRYALGKEGKESEEFFSSLQEIISHHESEPLLLIDSQNQTTHSTYLSHPAHA